MSTELSLSLCMIVRDEAACLARCLSSISGLVTEIIVVDTGSTDHTVDIAREYGARVFTHAWTGDFSEARNLSISHATRDWVLCLDADEELAADARDVVRALISTTTAEGLQVTIRNLNPPGETTIYEESAVTRFFRHRSEYRFEGGIHEQIAPSIVRAGGKIEAIPSVIILHHGYVTSQAQGQDRALRDLRALEVALAGNPDDAYLHFQFGATCQAAGDAKRAEKELMRALELNRGELSQELIASAFCKLAQLALARRDDKVAAERAKLALGCDTHSAIALQVLGVALAGLGDSSGARTAFIALAKEPRVTAEVRAKAQYLVQALSAHVAPATELK